ncbi:MAG TPA: hypothetical protein P5137_05175 [Candidatus Brocadiia bacterium]|nr:hypothetical protein [Candidatus Brocadiia bacterium]
MCEYEDAPPVTHGDRATASWVAPPESAQRIFRRPGLCSPSAQEAWYGLFEKDDQSILSR